MEAYRVRLLAAHESIARARRNGSAGQWVVEQYFQPPVGTGYYFEISAHLTEGSANRARARKERKN